MVAGVKVQTSLACASTTVTPASTLQTFSSARTSGTGIPRANSTDRAADQSKAGLPGGATAGIVVGCLVGVVLVAGLLWFRYRGRIMNAALRFPKWMNTHEKTKAYQNVSRVGGDMSQMNTRA